MALKSKDKKSKEEKKRERQEKKAARKEAKKARKEEKKGKKKGDGAEREKQDVKGAGGQETQSAENSEKKKSPPGKSTAASKRRFSIKAVVTLVLVLAAVAGSAYVVYRVYFTGTDTEKAVYEQKELANVALPEEMLWFSFVHMNNLYDALREYNRRITLINGEIERIENIADKYPEQSRIAQREAKEWEKAKKDLQRAFDKIEKEVKDLFVLYSVNRTRGETEISEKREALVSDAQEALDEVAGLLKRVDTGSAREEKDQGFVKNTINTVKNIFQ